MKKHIFVILALALAFGLLAGCSPADAELWAALQRTSEADFTATETLSWSVTENVPIETKLTEAGRENGYDEFYMPYDDAYSEALKAVSLFLEDFTFGATQKKQGGLARFDFTVAKPDMRFKFAAWTDGTDETSPSVIFKIPSYLTGAAFRGKDYITMKPVRNETLSGDAIEAYTKEITDFTEYIKSVLPSLAGQAQITGGAEVYTVRLDAAALRFAADKIIAALADNEGRERVQRLANAYIDVALATAEENGVDEDDLAVLKASRETFLAGYDEAIKNARAYAPAIGEQIEKSGLLKNGLTIKYTVKNGLIEKQETEFALDVDIEAISEAVKAIGAIISGEEPSDYEPPYVTEGSFTVTGRAVTSYDYSPVEISFPEVTAENSVDYAAETEEYNRYLRAKIEHDETWKGYYRLSEKYNEENPDGAPLTVKNLANGVELTVTPFVNPDDDYGTYIPASEIEAILGCGGDYNADIDAYVLEIDGEKIGVFGDEGREIYWEYLDGSDYGDGEYTGGELTAGQAAAIAALDGISVDDLIFTEDGEPYLELSNVLETEGYVFNLEGSVLTVDRAENQAFTFDGIEDNFFYLLNYGY